MTSRHPHRINHPSSSLFENYPGNGDTRNRPGSASPANRAGHGGNPYSYSNGTLGPGMTSAPHADGSANGALGGGAGGGGFRPATPNSKGQYSDSVLSSLESQNNAQESVLLSKVSAFKSLAVAMGDEIRDSSALADRVNETFEGTSLRLRGTMNRMLRMAERTGIGWKVWLLFFLAVWTLFAWVWLF